MLLDQESDSQGWVLKAVREAGNSIIRELSGIQEKVLRSKLLQQTPAFAADVDAYVHP